MLLGGSSATARESQPAKAAGDDTVSDRLCERFGRGTDGKPSGNPAGVADPKRLRCCARANLPVQATPVRWDGRVFAWTGSWRVDAQAIRRKTSHSGRAHNRGKKRSDALPMKRSGVTSARFRSVHPASKTAARETLLQAASAQIFGTTSVDIMSFALLWRRPLCAVVSIRSAAATEVAVAVLVVTCPCALGIATPLAYELSSARLVAAWSVCADTIVFDRARTAQSASDKNGTVTLSEPTCEQSAAAWSVQRTKAARKWWRDRIIRSAGRFCRRFPSLASRTVSMRQPKWKNTRDWVSLAASVTPIGWERRALCCRQTPIPADSQSDSDSSEPQSVFGCDGVPFARFSFRKNSIAMQHPRYRRSKHKVCHYSSCPGIGKIKVSRIGRQLGICDAFGGLSPNKSARWSNRSMTAMAIR